MNGIWEKVEGLGFHGQGNSLVGQSGAPVGGVERGAI